MSWFDGVKCLFDGVKRISSVSVNVKQSQIDFTISILDVMRFTRRIFCCFGLEKHFFQIWLKFSCHASRNYFVLMSLKLLKYMMLFWTFHGISIKRESIVLRLLQSDFNYPWLSSFILGKGILTLTNQSYSSQTDSDHVIYVNYS